MNLIILEEPAVEPVTLAQVYKHLRLTPDGDLEGSPTIPLTHPDDEMLQLQIATARRDCENTTRRAFVRQKLRMITGPTDERFPWRRIWYQYSPCRGVELQRPPLIELVEVSYFDGDNVLQVVDPAQYYLTEDEPARLAFGPGFTPPLVYSRPDALRIDYWAGYPPEGSPWDDFVTRVPAPIKSAILLGVELQYEALSPQQRERLEKSQASFLTPYTIMVAV